MDMGTTGSLGIYAWHGAKLEVLVQQKGMGDQPVNGALAYSSNNHRVPNFKYSPSSPRKIISSNRMLR
jgi:hypothetical protein